MKICVQCQVFKNFYSPRKHKYVHEKVVVVSVIKISAPIPIPYTNTEIRSDTISETMIVLPIMWDATFWLLSNHSCIPWWQILTFENCKKVVINFEEVFSLGGFICTSLSWLSLTSSSSRCCWTRMASQMIECYQFRCHFAEPQNR